MCTIKYFQSLKLRLILVLISFFGFVFNVVMYFVSRYVVCMKRLMSANEKYHIVSKLIKFTPLGNYFLVTPLKTFFSDQTTNVHKSSIFLLWKINSFVGFLDLSFSVEVSMGRVSRSSSDNSRLDQE